MFRDSTAGIGTGYGLEDRGSIPGEVNGFSLLHTDTQTKKT
jgi:hypothetical protein